MTRFDASAWPLILATSILCAGACGCRTHSHGWDATSLDSETHGAAGEVTISKMGGDIDLDDAPHGATLSTMGGGIHVGHVASFLKAKTMGGEIEIEHTIGPVDATTMGGGITIDSANGPIKATTMGGEVTAHMVGTSTGQRDVELSSQGGSITLTVPRDFGMDVRITLAHTQNAPRKDYHITAPAGLVQEETPDWDSSIGSPRKFIRAQGRIGDGANHVVIKTVNGDVILKQE